MSRKYNIRWKQSDSEELRKAVKNFNAKISRLEKKDPLNKSALPEKISVRQMKELIETRQDLNRELKALRRFTERGSEVLVKVPGNDYNLKITKWQKQEMNRRVGIINRKRKKRLDEIKDIEMSSRGEKLGYTRGELGMGSVDSNAYQPMNAFTKKMSRQDLKAKFEAIMKESQSIYWNRREETMRNNYIESLRKIYGNDADDMVDAIENMSFPEFRKIFEAEGGTFEFVSDPPDIDEKYHQFLEAEKSKWIPNK